MTASRRDLLRWGAAALVLRVPLRAGEPVQKQVAPSRFAPGPWIRIEKDGSITFVVARSEMGQGVRTSYAMVLAEELEAAWGSVRVETPSPGPDHPRMRTGGSGSVQGGYAALRRAGAAAREMLVAAGAARFGVEPASCRAELGSVIHPATGRRLGYGELVADAARLEVPNAPVLKDPKAFRLVGRPMLRVDGPAIVTGKAVYGLDVKVPGLRYAALARCPVTGGKPVRWDDARARQVPGVRAVVPAAGGVAVVADGTWAAIEGRDLLDVTWDEGAGRDFSSAAFWQRLEDATRAAGYVARNEGDVEAALAAAPRRLEATYRFPFLAHAAIEPMNAIAHVREGSCEIWTGTQAANQAQELAAKQLGLAASKVVVHVPLLGGGFGRRLGVDVVGEAVEVSRAVGGPVQVVWTRDDDLKRGHFQPASAHRMEAALDAAGRVTAWRHRMAGSFLSILGAPDLASPTLARDWAWGIHDFPYLFPNVLSTFAPVESPVKTGPWRAVHYPPTVFARESFLDECAHAAGKDPLAYRLDCVPDHQVLKVGGVSIDTARYRKVATLAAEKAGWGRPLRTSPGRRRGRGLATNVYDGDTHVAMVAEVSVGREGDLVVERIVCAVDCGTVVNPLGAAAQVEGGVIWGLSATRHGEITFEKGRVQQSSFADFPVATIRDTPSIEAHFVPSAGPPTGLGEPPVPPVAPAVANAIFAATGRRVRKLPILAADLFGPPFPADP